MSTTLRLYIHACGPAFRGVMEQEVRSLLRGVTPRKKIPKITKVGNSGLAVRVSLRDLYILAHGLRTADDILVHLTKPGLKVGSLNKLIQSLQAIPIHAFAPRVMPFRHIRREGKLTPEEAKEEEYHRQEAEKHLLHNNIRVLIDKSILSNREVVRKFASETFRAMLLLKRGQTIKHKNVKYTDNPVLFGKSEQEGEEILQLMADKAREEVEAELLSFVNEENGENDDIDHSSTTTDIATGNESKLKLSSIPEPNYINYKLDVSEIMSFDGTLSDRKMRYTIDNMINEQRLDTIYEKIQIKLDEMKAKNLLETEFIYDETSTKQKNVISIATSLDSDADQSSTALEITENSDVDEDGETKTYLRPINLDDILQEARKKSEDVRKLMNQIDNEFSIDDGSIEMIKSHIYNLIETQEINDNNQMVEISLVSPEIVTLEDDPLQKLIKEAAMDILDADESDEENIKRRYLELVGDPDDAAELEAALLRISNSTDIQGVLMRPSLLIPSVINVGATNNSSTNKPKSKAADSTPTLQSFLPQPYAKYSDGKLKRTARSDPQLRKMLERAQLKVDSMTIKLRTKDNKVKRAVAAFNNTDQPPALYIPPKPVPEVVSNAMTLQLDKNTLNISLSAIGQQNRALFKRGWRTHIIETSMRETVANGCISLAYEYMTPLNPASPLAKIETDPTFLKPLQEAYHKLSAGTRLAKTKHDEHNAFAKRQQNRMVGLLTKHMGADSAQSEILRALMEDADDVLSTPMALQDLKDGPLSKKEKDAMLFGQHSIPKGVMDGSVTFKEAISLDDDSFITLLSQSGLVTPAIESKPLTAKTIGNAMNNNSDKEESTSTTKSATSSKKKTIGVKTDSSSPSSTTDSTTDSTNETDSKSNLQTSGSNGVVFSTQAKLLIELRDIVKDARQQGLPEPFIQSMIEEIPTLSDIDDMLTAEMRKITAQRNKKKENDDGVMSPAAIINAISKLPLHHQVQASTSLAVGIPFDSVAPLPSPAVVGLRKNLTHARDSTQLSEVLSYTLANAITDSDPAVRIFDPFCGSGTLVIESVFRFLGLPSPPLPRGFAFENWPIHNEYEYNAMMREWNNMYEEIVQQYVQQYGISKTKSLFGEDFEDEDMSLTNFPLFIGSDLREKSIRASVHNASNARVNYFTQFYKSDFERIIQQGANKWGEYEAQKLNKARQEGAETPNVNNVNPFQSESIIKTPEYATPSPTGIYTQDDILRMQGFDIPTARVEKPAPVAAVSPFKSAQDLPLRFPYLKGYTMFCNVPWGVSDDKAFMTGTQRTQRGDRFNRGHVNTTQNESMDSLYQRLGGSLYKYGHMFRDVFILSAHHKFEKMISIGAQKAAMREDKNANKHANAVMVKNQIAKLQMKGDIEFECVTSFYNQGVRTDLLKLKK